MDEKDQKIEELEQRLEETQRELDAWKRNAAPNRYDNRKQLKPWKFVLIVVGVFAVFAAAVLAVVFALMNSDKQSPAMAEELLRAIIAQDSDRAYALIYPGKVDREEFDLGFAEMCAAWRTGGGGDTFELKRTGWSMNASGGVTQYTSQYEVTSGGARFTFRLTRAVKGDNAGMTGAQISAVLP